MATAKVKTGKGASEDSHKHKTHTRTIRAKYQKHTSNSNIYSRIPLKGNSLHKMQLRLGNDFLFIVHSVKITDGRSIS